MQLVYKHTRTPVAVGDKVKVNGVDAVVEYFRPPHKPSSEGKVSLSIGEFYVGVIGAEWINRTDR